MGGVKLDALDADPDGALGGGDEIVADLLKSCSVESERRVVLVIVGARWRARRSASRAGRVGAIWCPPSHGRAQEAFRPAWPSWIATGMSEWTRSEASTLAIAASFSSL